MTDPCGIRLASCGSAAAGTEEGFGQIHRSPENTVGTGRRNG